VAAREEQEQLRRERDEVRGPRHAGARLQYGTARSAPDAPPPAPPPPARAAQAVKAAAKAEEAASKAEYRCLHLARALREADAKLAAAANAG
jgi:hypothetical protein